MPTKLKNYIFPLSKHFTSLVSSIALFTAIYFIAGKFGLMFATVHQSASAIWPPTGIALAALLLLGYRLWPGVFLGAFLVNVTTAGSVFTSFCIAVGNTLEVLIAAYLINKYADGTKFKNNAGNAFRFIVFGGILAPVVAALIGPLSLFIEGFATKAQLGPMIFTWWLGDSTGALLLAPFIILWQRLTEFKWLEDKFIALEVFSVLFLIFLMASIVFGNLLPFAPPYPIAFAIVPFLLWAAIRLGRREAMSAVLLLAILATRGTILGYGQFAQLPPPASLLILQIYLAVMAASTLMFSVLAYEERKNRKTIIARAKYFRSLIEKSFDAIISVNAKGIILYASPSIERILGYSPAEMAGKLCFDFLYPEDRTQGEVAFTSLIAVPHSKIMFETRFVRKDGTIVWTENVRTNLLDEKNVHAVISNIRDITERRELANAKNSFISALSHRLHPPLTHIETYASALSEKKNRFDKLDQKYIEEIKSANRKAITLTADLLRLTRIELGTIHMELRVVDVRKAINSIIQECMPKIQSKGILLERRYPSSNTFLTIDQNLATLILRRLIIQIIESTPKGNKISVELTKSESEIFIHISYPHVFLAHGNTLQSNFKLPISELKNTDEDDLSLGLYTVQSLIEFMGGKIHLESQGEESEALSISFPNKPQAPIRQL